jgi:ankyrin repeat protein
MMFSPRFKPFAQGYTALHLAADRGNVATVELLLKHGANKTLKVSARSPASIITVCYS